MAFEEGNAAAVEAYGNPILSLNLSKEDCINLLGAENAEGTPGVFKALEEEHTEVIEAYGDLLKLILKEQLAELFAAKSVDGTTRRLFQAPEEWEADTVELYENFLVSIAIPEEQRVELLGIHA